MHLHNRRRARPFQRPEWNEIALFLLAGLWAFQARVFFPLPLPGAREDPLLIIDDSWSMGARLSPSKRKELVINTRQYLEEKAGLEGLTVRGWSGRGLNQFGNQPGTTGYGPWSKPLPFHAGTRIFLSDCLGPRPDFGREGGVLFVLCANVFNESTGKTPSGDFSEADVWLRRIQANQPGARTIAGKNRAYKMELAGTAGKKLTLSGSYQKLENPTENSDGADGEALPLVGQSVSWPEKTIALNGQVQEISLNEKFPVAGSYLVRYQARIAGAKSGAVADQIEIIRLVEKGARPLVVASSAPGFDLGLWTQVAGSLPRLTLRQRLSVLKSQGLNLKIPARGLLLLHNLSPEQYQAGATKSSLWVSGPAWGESLKKMDPEFGFAGGKLFQADMYKLAAATAQNIPPGSGWDSRDHSVLPPRLTDIQLEAGEFLRLQQFNTKKWRPVLVAMPGGWPVLLRHQAREQWLLLTDRLFSRHFQELSQAEGGEKQPTPVYYFYQSLLQKIQRETRQRVLDPGPEWVDPTQPARFWVATNQAPAGHSYGGLWSRSFPFTADSLEETGFGREWQAGSCLSAGGEACPEIIHPRGAGHFRVRVGWSGKNSKDWAVDPGEGETAWFSAQWHPREKSSPLLWNKSNPNSTWALLKKKPPERSERVFAWPEEKTEFLASWRKYELGRKKQGGWAWQPVAVRESPVFYYVFAFFLLAHWFFPAWPSRLATAWRRWFRRPA